MSKSIDILFERIAVWSLCITVLLIPVIGLPWTVDALEINKQTVLLLGTAVAALAWLGMMMHRKELTLKKTWLFLFPVLFLLSATVSAVLSIAPVVSWVGQSLQEYTSLLTLVAFVAMFVIAAHVLAKTEVQRTVWSLSLFASAVVSLVNLLDIIDVVELGTNLIGTPSALGLYLATMATIGGGLWLVADSGARHGVLPRGWRGVVVRICIALTMFGALVVTLALDQWSLWIAMIVGLGLLFVFALLRANEFPSTSRFLAPMFLFAIALIFLFAPSFLFGTYPTEVSPSHASSWEITKSTWADHGWFFGSGPGTFVMDYTKYYDAEINQTIFWDTRFDRAVSHFFTVLATFGLLGTAFFVAFILTLLGASLMMLLKERAHDEWKMTLVALTGWSVLGVGIFLYPSDMTLSFLFWMLSAVLLSQIRTKIWQASFRTSPRSALASSFLFVLVSVGIVTLMFVSVSRYAAEIAFARAVSQNSAGVSVEEVLVDLDAAARFNRWSDIYYRNLGNALLLQTASVIENPNVDPEYIRALISSSVSAAQRAVDISPSNVLNWSLLGDIYREVSPLIGDADAFAIASYQEAIELAPSNPKYPVALARALLVHADSMALLADSEDQSFAAEAAAEETASLEEAVKVLLAAIDLKEDYAPAHYYLALTYTRQGNLADAISRLEALRAASPLDVGVGFQLGLLYLQQGKTDLAQAELERIVEISPNYSNALWYLSVVYEQEGDVEAAIEMVETVLELNPDNSLAQKRLEDLNAGLITEEIPEPVEAGDADIVEAQGDVSVGAE